MKADAVAYLLFNFVAFELKISFIFGPQWNDVPKLQIASSWK